jgi:hypothetical protein
MTRPLPQPIRQALDAVNDRDAAAFAACFRPHLGCVDDWGRKHRGDRDILRWSERELVDKRAALKVIHFYLGGTDGATTVIAQLDRNDFQGPVTLTFRLNDQLIDTLSVTA